MHEHPIHLSIFGSDGTVFDAIDHDVELESRLDVCVHFNLS